MIKLYCYAIYDKKIHHRMIDDSPIYCAQFDQCRFMGFYVDCYFSGVFLKMIGDGLHSPPAYYIDIDKIIGSVLINRENNKIIYCVYRDDKSRVRVFPIEENLIQTCIDMSESINKSKISPNYIKEMICL